MAKKRTGAASWLAYMQVGCRMSHIPGFRLGLEKIIGVTSATTFYNLWTPLCTAIEAYMSTDDNPFQVDATTGEFQDRVPA